MSLRSSRIRSPRVRRVKAGFVALRLRYHDKRSAITITAIAVLSAAETADFTIARRRCGEHFYRAQNPLRHRYSGHNLSPASVGSPWTIAREEWPADRINIEEERAGRVDEHEVMKSMEEEENTGAQEENETQDERSAGAYTPAGRKYGKRRPASFSSIRFELLSSRRALSIVAENYFIIARSAGLKCSRRGPVRRRRGLERGADGKPSTRRMTVQRPRFHDLLILRRKTTGPLRKTSDNLSKRVDIVN
ncbi:PREDICTED: uncharacterized protein LOC105455929 [Wasmannia auropunctata]|uniref:uncharacterized protein LOC105455929 n=1 Tax=Wasmannia auropunctata TaxID=64793 RepID=UPI0005EE50D8|nr:PREDICTED: uncharacterized protein LOC105455929 [Wasmannia auropunctata]